MDRTILHCDLNGFYASVECIGRPELRSVPMAVGGDPESRHGIILAKNELAKRRGVVTAETIWQARRKCPELVVVPPHHERYAEYSEKSTPSTSVIPIWSSLLASTKAGWTSRAVCTCSAGTRGALPTRSAPPCGTSSS